MQDYVRHSGDLLDFMQIFFISIDVVKHIVNGICLPASDGFLGHYICKK